MDQKNRKDKQHHGHDGQHMHESGSSQQFPRDQAEGSRENVNTDDRNRHDDERGSGNHGERNGGISNRGMGRSSEQQDLPQRGSTRESDR